MYFLLFTYITVLFIVVIIGVGIGISIGEMFFEVLKSDWIGPELYLWNNYTVYS